MREAYITSDNHFYHKNILKYQKEERPFDDVLEMNEVIIERHNEVVKDKDDIYYLGDFAMTGNNNIIEILKRLNGRKHFVFGNHDRQMKHDSVKEYFDWMFQYHELKVKQYGFKIPPITLFHYPMERWNRKSYGSFHFFGHTHSNEFDEVGRFNVGVDNHNLYPWSLAEAIENLESIGRDNNES